MLRSTWEKETVWEKERFFTVLGLQTAEVTSEICVMNFQKVKVNLSWVPSILLIGTHPKDMVSYFTETSIYNR